MALSKDDMHALQTMMEDSAPPGADSHPGRYPGIKRNDRNT